MNKNELYDALSGIDKKYIERSEDIEGISAEFKRAKIRRVEKIISFTACIATAVIVSVNIYDMDFLGKNDLINEHNVSERADDYFVNTNISAPPVTNTEINTLSAQTEKSSADNKTVLKTESVGTNTIVTKTAFTEADVKTDPGFVVTAGVYNTTVRQTTVKHMTEKHTTAKCTTIKKNTTLQTEKPAGINTVPVTEVSKDYWESMDVYKQYDIVFNDDVKYLANTLNVKTISDERIGDKINDITVSGFDTANNQPHTSYAEIFAINNISADDCIAVKFAGYDDYYLYTSMEYLVSNNTFADDLIN